MAFRKSANGGDALKGGHFTDQELLIADLIPCLTDEVTVLVKGSRSARMERVVKALLSVQVAASGNVTTESVVTKGVSTSRPAEETGQ